MSIAIFDTFCSANYESEIKKVLLRQVFQENEVLWAKNHDFYYFLIFPLRWFFFVSERPFFSKVRPGDDGVDHAK